MPTYDLRPFVRWITETFEPAVRLPGGAGQYARTVGETVPELYGVSDMACVLYTISHPRPTDKQRTEWLESFTSFQDPATGYLLERKPTHSPLHNTAFALAAMELLDLSPKYPLKLADDFKDPAAYLRSLNWKTQVYPESHKGAGFGAVFALYPSLATPAWFDSYFETCDSYFDFHNGMMGHEKPATGDFDQIGGTFHYHFLYEHFHRRMPYPERRIDSVIGLQQPDGYWHPTNHLWLTLDAVYLMTRTLRYTTHRHDDVTRVVRRVMDVTLQDIFSDAGRTKSFMSTPMGVHSLTCAVNLAAEAQLFLGAQEVQTDWPLRPILDRRPFI